jgi:hypothetical protein
MIKKFVVSVFCMLVIISGFSFGVLAEQNKKIIISENIVLEVNPIEKNDYALNIYTNPVVEITSPENGTLLPTNYLEVLGHASSSDGLKSIEWEHYRNNYLVYYDNDTFNISNNINFRIRIFYLQPGIHKVVVRFYDIYNHSGSDSVTVYYGNLPPEKPNKPSGPDTGSIGGSYSYSTASTDPNNDTIKYGWDWNGDGTIDQWTNLSNSGMTISTAHTFTSPGTYNIKVMAEDKYGAQSMFSEPLQVLIQSNPPNKPNTPDGSARGKPGVSYSYQTSTTDPDGDQVYYMWDWGDGTTLTWDGPYNSGQTAATSHIWSTKGSYSIKVKAKDTTGAESVWSDPFPVTMPNSYNKQIPQFLELLSQRFATAFPLLRQLMGK